MTVAQLLPTTGQDKVFDALEIRNTSDHLSSVSTAVGFVPKTLIVENDLDQTVTFQLEGSSLEAFTKVIDVGSTFTVAATTNDYQTLSDYFPYLRVKATCATAPTTGSLTCYLEKIQS